MPTTNEQAYVTITNHFQAFWDGRFPDVPVRYWGVETDALPKGPFVRFHMQEVIEGQSTLRDGKYGQRYTNEGLVAIQVFAPRAGDTPAELSRLMAEAARAAFRGRHLAGGIWFRRVRVNDLDPEDKWFRKNVLAEYRFDVLAKTEQVSNKLTAQAEITLEPFAEL